MKDTKLCGSCQTEKPVSDFYPIKSGFHSECKVCSKARYNEWRRANRKKHAERNNKWFHENKESVFAQQKIYRAEDAHKDRRRREYERHGDKIRVRATAWRKANPEKRRVAHLRREARKRELPKTWTVEQMRAAIAHFKNTCAVCGIDLDGRHHWDHWIPLIAKTCPGTTGDNMIPLCGRCNTRKNDTMPDVWLKRLFPTTWQEIKARVETYLKNQKD